MGTMPQMGGFSGTGDKVRESGFYACANCSEIIYLNQEEKFPKCEKCKDFVYWYRIS